MDAKIEVFLETTKCLIKNLLVITFLYDNTLIMSDKMGIKISVNIYSFYCFLHLPLSKKNDVH